MNEDVRRKNDASERSNKGIGDLEVLGIDHVKSWRDFTICTTTRIDHGLLDGSDLVFL